jgi:hypothetical protein
MILVHMADKPRARRTAAERGRHMTTLELPPDLVKAARIYGAERGLPLRVVVEQALRAFLARKEKKT